MPDQLYGGDQEAGPRRLPDISDPGASRKRLRIPAPAFSGKAGIYTF